EPGRAGRDFELVVPYWMVTSVLAAPAVLLLGFDALGLVRRRTHSANRRQSGACEICNYDLRASTDRCPECGHPIPATTDAKPQVAKTTTATPPPADPST